MTKWVVVGGAIMATATTPQKLEHLSPIKKRWVFY